MVGFPYVDHLFQAIYKQQSRHDPPRPSVAKAVTRVMQRKWAVVPQEEWTDLEKDMIWDSLLIGIACGLHHPYAWIVNYEAMGNRIHDVLEYEYCIAALWTGWAKVYDLEVDVLCNAAHTYAEENNVLEIPPDIVDTDI